jgi:hypothetical protein
MVAFLPNRKIRHSCEELELYCQTDLILENLLSLGLLLKKRLGGGDNAVDAGDMTMIYCYSNRFLLLGGLLLHHDVS